MGKNFYFGTIKKISEVKNIEKEKAITSFHGNMKVEGKLEVLSHEGTNVVTQSHIILETEEGEKPLDFLGYVPQEYVGERVRLTTEYSENKDIVEIKHELTGVNVPKLEGSLKVRYVPQIGYLGKGEMLFGHAGGRMKRL